MNQVLDFMISKVKPEENKERVVLIAGFRGWALFVDGELVERSDGFPHDTPAATKLNLQDWERGLALCDEYQAKLTNKN